MVYICIHVTVCTFSISSSICGDPDDLIVSSLGGSAFLILCVSLVGWRGQLSRSRLASAFAM